MAAPHVRPWLTKDIEQRSIFSGITLTIPYFHTFENVKSTRKNFDVIPIRYFILFVYLIGFIFQWYNIHTWSYLLGEVTKQFFCSFRSRKHWVVYCFCIEKCCPSVLICIAPQPRSIKIILSFAPSNPTNQFFSAKNWRGTLSNSPQAHGNIFLAGDLPFLLY